ncbi:unnamed protein product [Notodromas monacha]|uniref:Uncharacterized protein n=1 Tax=Notodromas monacha TaxID=399045 RepID=A0A7R9BUG2_9CRUS|nr:unnamed protein product [Notodromas monacha]CAG0920959.1 unnamed protein product [Notodromas monacha]
MSNCRSNLTDFGHALVGSSSISDVSSKACKKQRRPSSPVAKNKAQFLRQRYLQSSDGNPDESSSKSAAVAKKDSKTKVLSTSQQQFENASVAEAIAKRKHVVNYWRNASGRTTRRRVQIGPWKREDLSKLCEQKWEAISEQCAVQFSVRSDVTTEGIIELLSISNQEGTTDDTSATHTAANDIQSQHASIPSPVSSGLSLKLKKIGSGWKPIAEEELGEPESTEILSETVHHRVAKKKKHHHHHHVNVETDGVTHEERKLMKKRRKLLKQLRKSLKQQEKLERAVEQSKERAMKKPQEVAASDSVKCTSQRVEQCTEDSPAVNSEAPSIVVPKTAKNAAKPIAVVAGQPQAKQKPVESVEKMPEKKFDEKSVDAKNPSASTDSALLKHLLDVNSSEILKRADGDASIELGKDPVPDSIIKKLLDETSRDTSALLEKKSQNILEKFLNRKTKPNPEAQPDAPLNLTKLGKKETSSGSINIADLPPAPAAEVQYLRQVLKNQLYDIPSSLVIPRDQLIHFYTYPIRSFCSLLAKQAVLFNLVSGEPDAILDGRVIVFATKQLPDILEHPKNYLPVILGSPLSSDAKDNADPSLLKTLLEKESDACCDSPMLQSRKPLPCLVKLPKQSAEECDTVSSAVPKIRVRDVESLQRIGLDELHAMGATVPTPPTGRMLLDLLGKEHRNPTCLSQTDAGIWFPRVASSMVHFENVPRSREDPKSALEAWVCHQGLKPLQDFACSSNSSGADTSLNQLLSAPPLFHSSQLNDAMSLPGFVSWPTSFNPLPIDYGAVSSNLHSAFPDDRIKKSEEDRPYSVHALDSFAWTLPQVLDSLQARGNTYHGS